MHYVYILRCGDGSLYCGYTIDIAARLEMHKSGKGAKYTKGRAPLTLVYSESFETKSLALKRELVIKKLSREEKLQLINNK